jgi:glyoxylase-like metal-dependent hydrolase (beta-lactamase superfamily II)
MSSTVWAFPCAFLLAASLPAADPAIEAAAKALGVNNIKTIQFSGSGAIFTVGQSRNPNGPWPRVDLQNVQNTHGFEKPAARVEATQNNQRIRSFLSEGHAWNVAPNGNVVPQLAAADQRKLMIATLTPHGFVKAAQASNAKVKGRTVSFLLDGKRKVTGTLNPDNTVRSIATIVDNPVLGDMPLTVEFSEYKDFGGVKFPAKIVESEGGHPATELIVTEVKTNVDLDLTIPDNVKSATPPAVRVESQKIGDGLWYVTGGSHHSVVVEFKDHVAVIEGPQTEARALAVMAETKKLVPNKPVRYLVPTHHHFDHSGGIRPFAAEGATIVTHQMNREILTRAVSAPRTLNPGKYPGKVKAKFLTFTDKHVLTDGNRVVELYLTRNNPHADAMTMIYFPKEKILVEADVYSPPAQANAPPPASPSPNTVAFYEEVTARKLDVAQIAPIHGRIVPMSDLARAAGK